MTPKHRREPVRTGSAIRRAVVTSVVSSLALSSVTITAAAVTLTSSPVPRAMPPAADAPGTTSRPPTAVAPADPPPAPPAAQVKDLPVGIPDIELVVADSVRLDAISDTAVAAYQRAAAVLGSADKQCNLRWTLVAAVGQVVSGHGTTGDSKLGKQGVVKPQLAGDPLRGRDGKRVPDSDAGRLDGDGRFDRPVGPMQLSPATWAVVGVDSDGDGRRNPNDIDDAALAVSVLLCSGKDDMRRRGGRIEAIRRVNDGKRFVESVLDVARTYRGQLSDLYATAPLVVPTYTMPTLPVVAKGDAPTDGPTHGSTGPTTDSSPDSPSTPPTPNYPTPTTPTTPAPTVPTVPTPSEPPPTTHPPRDPADELPAECPTTSEPPEPVVTEPTDAPSDEATGDPSEVPSDEPTPEPPADPIVKPGCDDSTEPNAG